MPEERRPQGVDLFCRSNREEGGRQRIEAQERAADEEAPRRV